MIATSTPTPAASSRRYASLAAGLGLLGMAVLAPIAHFGVLETLVQPNDATATVSNILAAEGSFRLAVAALLVVSFLDMLVAWAVYILLRPVNRPLALLAAWLRLAAAAAFLPALANLLDVAQLLGGTATATVPAVQLEAQVMASLASFHNGWDIILAVFGLHLVGVGVLVFRSVAFPRFLGVLVAVAGLGYLADTFARILVPDFDFTFSHLTFVGEPLLIGWFLWRAIKGFTDEPGDPRQLAVRAGAAVGLPVVARPAG